jgi:hypothetical protein
MRAAAAASAATAAVSAALALLACAAGCRARPTVEVTAAAWPEADRLFRGDPRWLGADDAYSIDLGDLAGGRVVWLFADTFIATSPAGVRAESRMVHNTVGVQDGLDPTTATMAFAWNDSGADPASFFAEDADVWYWPGDGVLVDGALLVFLMATRASTGGLGFESAGWQAALVANPSDPPATWNVTRPVAPQNDWGVIVGSATAFADGDYIYAFSTRGPAQDVFLLRWRRAAAAAGDLSAPEWRDGDAWTPESALASAPAPLFSGAQSELSVHRDDALGVWLLVQTVGFGATSIGVRTAPAPWGPWSAVEEVFRPPEAARADAFEYAAKAHPELAAGPPGTLAVTYVANATDFATLIADDTLYWPRFVRLTLSSSR